MGVCRAAHCVGASRTKTKFLNYIFYENNKKEKRMNFLLCLIQSFGK